ncbi:MAG: outer membrane protein [Candidatus Pelagisphaera sp.]|jgi:outer membrane protein
MKRVTLAALFLFANIPLAESAERLLISRQDAMALALERNLGIERGRSLVGIAEEGVSLEQGAFDPVLSGRFTSTDSGGQSSDSLSADLGGKLSTGATYNIGVDSNENLNTNGGFSSFAGISFNQPLLRDFGFAPNLAALRIARYRFNQSEWEFKQTLLDTLASTIFAFNDLYESQENLESSIRIRDLTAQTVKDISRRIEIGDMARLDIVEAQAQLASKQERVLSAENFVVRTQNRIKQLIFANAEDALAVDLEAEFYIEPEVSKEFASYLSSLLEKSPRYHVGEIALEIARLRLGRDRNGTLPSLGLIAQYGYSGFGNSIGGSLDSAVSDGNEAITFGASFRMPLLNRSARSQEAISKQQERIAKVDLDMLKQAIQLEFHSSYQIMQTNYKRLDATRLATELAEQSLGAEQKKLNAGTSSTFFVLRLQSALATAELREISAIAQYNRSVADFNRLRGVLE